MQSSFIPYLVLNDYLTTIRSDQLNNQLLDYIDQGGEFERREAESFAIDEVRKKLGSYFYLNFEFKSLLPFNYSKKYFAGDRCIIDFPLWVASVGSVNNNQDELTTNTYVIGNCVIESGIGYCCRVDNSDTTFNINNWIAIGNIFDIFYVNPPYNFFQLMPSQKIGINNFGCYTALESKVCWEKKIYLCKNSSRFSSHQFKEQFYTTNNIPSPNIFPNQPSNQYTDGNVQWIDKGEFFLKSELPLVPALDQEDLNEGVDAWTPQYRKQWTLGDNRSSTMKQIVIAIAISKLMGRNSFQLKERSINRDWAYRSLDKIKEGEDTTLIPILQPEQSGNISHGGSPKVINTF